MADVTEPRPARRNPVAFLAELSDPTVVSVVFVVALFMDIMDATIVNTALPAIGHDLHQTTSQLVWVVLGYLLSLAIWIPASGWIGDRFGTKRTFLFALFMFTAASVLCGSATSLTQLTAYRFFQGVGGGMLTPIGTAMLFRAYPPAQRARASAILIVPTLIAPALGPVLGGFLTDGPGWRWIFYVNAPIGALAFLFGLWRLKESRHEQPGQFDPAGFVLSGVAIASFLYALNQAESLGFLAPRVVIFGLVGIVGAVSLVAVELTLSEPMLALRLFRERLFRVTNLVSIFSAGSFFGLILLMPLMLQDVRHLSASQSGLTTFPQALGIIAASQLVRHLYARVGPRFLLVAGMFGAAVMMFTLQFTTLETNLWFFRAMLFARGLCMAFVFIPLQAATMARVAPADIARGSAIGSTNRQVSNSLAVGVLIAMLIAQFHKIPGTLQHLGHHAPSASVLQYNAFKVPFFWTAVFALVGAALALLIHNQDASGTMAPRAGAAVASTVVEPIP